MADEPTKEVNRRDLLKWGARGALVAAMGAGITRLAPRLTARETVWQIDPEKCIWCGKCATECVLTLSAAKCMRDQAACGYCEPCGGYQAPDRVKNIGEEAENQICPTRAITRKKVEYPFYEYTVDEDKCIGCAKCCEGCSRYGNKSMYMQIDHTYCVNCTECAIAEACPTQAFVQRPTDSPYWFLHRKNAGQDPWAWESVTPGQLPKPKAAEAAADDGKEPESP